MIVSYRQDDDTIEAVSSEDLSALETEAIEEVTGKDWLALDEALRAQDPTAMRAVLWVHRKRTHPTLLFSEFDLPRWRRRLSARMEYEEIRDVVEEARRAEAPAAKFEALLQHLRTLAHDAADVDRAVKDTVPKAEAKISRAASET